MDKLKSERWSDLQFLDTVLLSATARREKKKEEIAWKSAVADNGKKARKLIFSPLSATALFHAISPLFAVTLSRIVSKTFRLEDAANSMPEEKMQRSLIDRFSS